MYYAHYTTEPKRTRLPGNQAGKRHKKRQKRRARMAACLVPVICLMLAGLSVNLFLMRTRAEAAEFDNITIETIPCAETLSGPDADAVSQETVEPEPQWTRHEAEELAKAIWGEARGCKPSHQAAVAWCALNRVDSPMWADDLVAVLSQPNQFCGYDPEYPVDPAILAVAEDVLARYYGEKATGMQDPGRVLPGNYYYFTGDGFLNWFRTEYADTGLYWDWSLPSPYGD